MLHPGENVRFIKRETGEYLCRYVIVFQTLGYVRVCV
jgi:hypothetical protein